ncbi:MAG TPA: RNA 2',3'-cyclic phosphodiesterase [Candidatus Dormibacteraeota bacterium]|nr:RNA 2',3'-cyclic phosphodiesterase [Candidatus Dormibacteraeota bacterium]
MPEAHRQALAGYLDACARRAPEFRWTPPANLHLTIRFLGHVQLALAERIADSVGAAGLRAFDVELGAIGSFKRGRMARVVWIGVGSGTEDVAELAARVEAESQRAGLEAEDRPFHAHLTLARARPRDGASLPQLAPPPTFKAWRADELILYRSKLGRGGSIYEPMRRIRLS